MDRELVLSKVVDMNAPRELRTLHPRNTSIGANTTRMLEDPRSTSDDSDTDNDEHTADLPHSLLTDTQRKQAQNAVFEEFVREKDDSKLRERWQEAQRPMGSVDDFNSLETAGARRIIDRVRDYQSELFARAKAGNIIAVLDTGSGKTLIAALLLREIVTKEMDDRASGRSPRTSFFLVGHVWRLHMF